MAKTNLERIKELQALRYEKDSNGVVGTNADSVVYDVVPCAEEELPSLCPMTQGTCKEDASCAWWADGEGDSGCAIRILAEHLVGGAIGIKTYGNESVSVII